MMNFDCEKHLVLKVLAGSRAYGTSTDESDYDYRGVIVPPVEYLLGLSKFEPYVVHEDHIDIFYYDIRKFLHLAIKGNPTVLEILKAPVLSKTDVGAQLQILWPLLVSKRVVTASLGMATSHLKRIDQSGRNCDEKGKACIEKYGYNTKDACHVMRVLGQCVEILKTGELTLPRPNVQFLNNIRNGCYHINSFRYEAQILIDEVKSLESSSSLQSEPLFGAIESWLINVLKGFVL